MSNDNNVAAPKVPKTREQRNREKRRNHRRREEQKRQREESSSDDDIAIDVEDPQTRQGFCSFFNRHAQCFCNCAAEIRGYCCEHFELRVVKVLKQQGKKPEYRKAKRLLQQLRRRLARQAREKRQRFAKGLEAQAMAANGIKPSDFFFEEDVPDSSSEEFNTGMPDILLPTDERAQGGVKAMDMDDDDYDDDEEDEQPPVSKSDVRVIINNSDDDMAHDLEFLGLH
jgi:hypothetical protein